MTYPPLLDAFLIMPFRSVQNPLMGFLLGSAVLAFYCVLIGKFTQLLLEYAGRGYYSRLTAETQHSHNLSMQALHAGDKASYLAINSMAHERFGKQFFAQAALGTSSLWPVPFALAWLAARFEGIEIFTLPFATTPIGYPFVFILVYVAERMIFTYTHRNLTRIFRGAQSEGASRG